MKLALASLAALIPAAAVSAQLYTFDQGAQGWAAFNVGMSGHVPSPGQAGALTWDQSHGLPAPSLKLVDLAAETVAGAPAAALGNRSDLYGSTIEWDMFVTAADAAGYSPVVLAGASITLYHAPSRPGLNAWEHRSVSLVPGTWRVNGESGGAPIATEAQVRAVLADLRGLYIRTEYNTGADDTNLDNINVGNVAPPCPADFNGDGFLDFFDYDDYVGCFESGSCPPGKTADFNDDGFADFFDYDDFVAAFEAGC